MACDFDLLHQYHQSTIDITDHNSTNHSIMGTSTFASNTTVKAAIPIEITYHNVQQYINKIILPIVFSLGIFGNILNLVILSRRRIQHRMSEVEKASMTGLISLAISDMLFCFFGLVSHFLDPFSEASFNTFGHLSTISFYYSTYEAALLNTFLFTSTWIITIMSVERWAAARFPFVARRIASMRKTVYINIFIYIFSIVFNIPEYLESEVLRFDCMGNCSCLYKIPGPLYYHQSVVDTYRTAWAIFGTFLPILLLLFCNVMFLVEIYRSKKAFSTENRSMLGHTPNTSTSKAVARITVILVGIIISFFLLVCPSMILSLFKNSVDQMNTETYYKYSIAVVVANLTQGVNFAINFLLYCTMSREFRGTLTKMVCRRPSPTSTSFYNSPSQQASKLIDLTSRGPPHQIRRSSSGKSFMTKAQT